MQSYYWPIDKLPGLDKQEQVQLQTCQINNTKELLEKTKSDRAKLALAKELNLPVRHINKWVALADLARIPSVGCQYCGLLLHAGIISVSQLIEIPIHRLHQQILRLYVATLQRRDLCPSIETMQKWTMDARKL